MEKLESPAEEEKKELAGAIGGKKRTGAYH
jgi:hypothetical protein